MDTALIDMGIGMRYRVWTGLLLATLWNSAAMAQAPEAPLIVSDCETVEAALAAAPSASDELRARVQAACAPGAAAPSDSGVEPAVQQWRRDHRHAVAVHVQELTASADARSQLAAALLQPMTRQTGAGLPIAANPAFAAALRLGRNDPLVTWMEVLACPAGPGAGACDPQAALVRLQRLEPGNAAPALIAAGRALERGDTAAADRLLARAGRGSQYALPWGSISELLYAELLEAGGPPLDAQVAAALGEDFGLTRPATRQHVAAVGAAAISSAVAYPGFMSLQRLCLEHNAASEARRAPCITALSLMAQSDSLMARSVGVGYMARLTAGSPGAGLWRQRRRELRWLTIRGYQAVQENGAPMEHLRRLWRDGEVAALQAALRASGQPLTPPPGWVAPGRVPPGRVPPG